MKYRWHVKRHYSDELLLHLIYKTFGTVSSFDRTPEGGILRRWAQEGFSWHTEGARPDMFLVVHAWKPAAELWFMLNMPANAEVIDP